MVISVEVTGKLEDELSRCMMELDILTCQEGCCLDEPPHWTPQEVISNIVKAYLPVYTQLVRRRPVVPLVLRHIRPKTGIC